MKKIWLLISLAAIAIGAEAVNYGYAHLGSDGKVLPAELPPSGTGNIDSINADVTAAQTLSVGTNGADFNISDAGGGSHVLNLPNASAANRGALTTTDWSAFNAKIDGSGNPPSVAYWQTASILASNIFFTYGGAGDATGSFLGVGVATPLEKLHVVGNQILTGNAAIGDSAQFGLVSGTQRFVDIAQTITDFTATNSWRLHSDRLIIDPDSSSTSDTGTSTFSQVSIPDTNANDFGNIIANSALASHSGSGALTQNIGRISSATLGGTGSIATNATNSITCQALGSSAGSITNNYCDVFNSGNQSATSTITNDFVSVYRTPRTDGTVTNHRAIYAEDQTGADNSYFIYSEGGQSYHAGNFGIQNKTPPAPLTIANNIYEGITYDGAGGWAGTGTAIELLHGGVRSSWHSTTGEAGVGVKFGTETSHPLFIITNDTSAITINNAQQTDFSASAVFESDVSVNGRILGATGTLASANDATASSTGNLLYVTGTTAINTISLTNWTPGSVIVLLCSSNPVIHHNTAGAGASILLAGSADFTCAANATLTLVDDGTNWQETARKSP